MAAASAGRMTFETESERLRRASVTTAESCRRRWEPRRFMTCPWTGVTHGDGRVRRDSWGRSRPRRAVLVRAGVGDWRIDPKS